MTFETIKYTDEELAEARKLVLESKNTDGLQPYMWARSAKILLAKAHELEEDIKYWQQRYDQCSDIFWEQLRKLCEILDVPYRKTSFEKALELVQEMKTKFPTEK